MSAQKTSRVSAPEQTRSTIRLGPANDAFEQEAERAADAFMRGVHGGAPFSLSGISVLQRCACGQANAGGECDGCRKKRLQRAPGSAAAVDASGLEGARAPSIVLDVLSSSGRPLDRMTRARMEAHFGADFGDVRMHTDARAARSAESVGATAWTVGQHIAFGHGQFDPASHEGQHLLAHELSHVIQQGDGLRRRPLPRGVSGRPLGIRPDVMDEYDSAKLWEALKDEYRLRVETGELDDRDLSNWVITSRLNGLKSSQIDELVKKIKKHGEQNPRLSVAKIVEYLEVRKEVSTPMPAGSAVSRDPITQGIESYSLAVGLARVKVVADTSGHAANETGPTTNFPTSFSWKTDDKGLVSSLTTKVGNTDVPFNPTSFDVVIQTKYKERPDSTSAYGRGTEATDKENNATTLRVHEGSHGTDYISYLRTHPFPVDLSNGVVGVLTNAQMKSIAGYIKNFFKDAGTYSCEHTDQVGFTQKQFVKTPEGKKSGIVSCKP